MNFTKLPSGTWRVAVKHQGRRRTATAPTRSEAQQLGAELLLELGASPKVKSVTIDELCGVWMASSTLSITYRADAVRVIERLPDEFRARVLADVTPSVIEGLYRQLARQKWTSWRIRRAHTVLSSAYTLALRYEWATTVNPFSAARPPAVVRRRVHPPTPEQVDELFAATDGQFFLFVVMAAALGARRGELIGLQWTDITDSTVRIQRSLSYAPGEGVQTTEGKIGEDGHRSVALDDDLVTMLRAHRVQLLEEALASGLPAPVWVFSHDGGATPWRPDYASAEFRRARTRAGLPDSIRFHDLRHYVASQLLAAGVSLSVVGDRLGHKQYRTTSETYGHLVPAADQEAAAIMASLRRRPVAVAG